MYILIIVIAIALFILIRKISKNNTSEENWEYYEEQKRQNWLDWEERSK